MTDEERAHQYALDMLVRQFPSEYLSIASACMALIPNGGSRLFWRYRKQLLAALYTAEELLVANHPEEWGLCQDLASMHTLTPEDVISQETDQ
jgi:hypothetical protein